jgi:hypothetical protein
MPSYNVIDSFLSILNMHIITTYEAMNKYTNV